METIIRIIAATCLIYALGNYLGFIPTVKKFGTTTVKHHHDTLTITTEKTPIITQRNGQYIITLY